MTFAAGEPSDEGTLLWRKHELNAMQAHGYGSIANIASTYGDSGAAGALVYAAGVHAVLGLTKSAALGTAGSGISLNAAPPETIDAGMLDRFMGGAERKAYLVSGMLHRRFGSPDAITTATAVLVSDQSSLTIGQILSVDGGKSAA